jgi:hypothetical protein
MRNDIEEDLRTCTAYEKKLARERTEQSQTENVTLSFEQATALVIDAFDNMPVNEATAVLTGVSQLVDMKTLAPEGDSQLDDIKDFVTHFESKKALPP